MKKPRVLTRCVASRYARDDERIIEFSHSAGGGLVSLWPLESGRLGVKLYRMDSGVEVHAPAENIPDLARAEEHRRLLADALKVAALTIEVLAPGGKSDQVAGTLDLITKTLRDCGVSR